MLPTTDPFIASHGFTKPANTACSLPWWPAFSWSSQLAVPCSSYLREEPLTEGCTLQLSLSHVNKNGFCSTLPIEGWKTTDLLDKLDSPKSHWFVRLLFQSQSIQLLHLSQLISLLWVRKSFSPSPSVAAVVFCLYCCRKERCNQVFPWLLLQTDPCRVLQVAALVAHYPPAP